MNKNFISVAVIAVVNALGYGIIIPILYAYSKQFGLSDFENGLLFSTFAICAFFSTPVIGRLSDKYGRKPLLMLSLLGTAISFFLAAFAPNAIVLFIARALDGITAGNISVASAVIADTTDEKNRAKGFGVIGAAFGFGFVFGPAISAFTTQISIHLPFIIAGVITLVAILITQFFLSETNKHIGQLSHKKLFDFPRLWHALFEGQVGRTLLISLLYSTSFGLFIYTFQPVAYKVLHLQIPMIATLFTVFGIAGLITQAFIFPQLSKRVRLTSLFTVAIAWVGVAFTLLFFSRDLPLFLLSSIGLSLGNGVVNPLTQTILSRETDAKSQGSILGLNASYMSIGQILGPLFGGAIALYSLSGPFLLASAFCIVCFILSHTIHLIAKKESAF